MFAETILNLFESAKSFFDLLLPFVVIFFPIIIVHELGHLLAALACGVKPESFAVCFGPKLVSRKIKGIDWKLNLIPLGGYVSFASKGKENLEKKPYLSRLIILIAGPIANLLFALVLIFFVFTFLSTGYNLTVGDLGNDEQARQAGLRSGDHILAINGEPVSGACGDAKQLRSDSFATDYDGQEARFSNSDLSILRDQQLLNLTWPVTGAPRQLLVNMETRTCWQYRGLIAGVPRALQIWGRMLAATLTVYKDIIVNFVSGAEQENRLVGVVGISQTAEQMINHQVVFWALMYIAHFNFAIAIFNMLPIPIFDGGQILYITLEKVMPFLRSKNIKMLINGFSFLLIMTLMIVLIRRDIETPVVPTNVPEGPIPCRQVVTKNAACTIDLQTLGL